ncbi:IS3 family transposase [Ruminiclostridium cellulolyticum]|uniref:Transposase IS3/IS911 family protein n=1 Tax=Ruminiclostridium cellulolyticum (strain ATCC 35319 / DSM 5812 / JCM 6584 / H10) TaxID=394503 RepID=B8I5F9_RUMCH|nr:IS3 family transposase [Ruminiclostridium cellulolyticum]ACL74789.1 transposase IS3/IS911 family protein [Ruminiclostridium cellulolyticum H10]ACL75202.1 transposase IS3/IS911 family protein [Ruminiclostridium cellulolyticum H10]ACL76695.1 transposase IS3/IS911 family protein [Ruminiclostridium cellulolyticum H10]ACL76948.1 transposase IS3/IS911 family protein [Ruminiclostridium cellulolyticum H10]ACL77014.1 transposase IS3/IS911 family protein [Ruminiclostridium cellulolyticum H10]
MKKRRTFTPEQKTKIVLEVLKEAQTLTEIAAKYEIQPNQLTRWKSEFIKNANRAFSDDADETEQLKQVHEAQIDELHRQIGQLTVERNWLKKKLNNSACRQSRQSMVDKKHKKLTITRQCQLLGLNRSTLYYQPHEPDRSEEYRIKWLIDEIYTRDSSLGYRRMTHILHRDHGININKKRTRRYMREMNIYGICPGPNLSKRGRLKYVHPYLLRGLTIDRPNQVWSVDITYCRMPKGHMYLAAIIDWHSKYIVGYELSNTMDKSLVLNLVKRTITAHGKPEIINSDQGSQFTCEDYINLLKENNIKVSMDGKGQALDNICIERFWRSLKWEKLYLEEYSTPKQLRNIIQEYIAYYNIYRPHQTLEYRTPGEVYYRTLAEKTA